MVASLKTRGTKVRWPRWIMLAVSVLLVIAGCGTGTPNTNTSDSKPYYEGKSIEIIVPFAEGGGTDIWIRFVAPYLEKNIAGNPKITITNMPGGESITGANFFVENAKPDGTKLLAASGTTILPFLFNNPDVKYNFNTLKPILNTAAGGVIYTSPETGINAVKDIPSAKGTLVYGGIAPTGNDLVALLAFELLGMPVEGKFGYEGRSQIFSAFGKGETNIDFQTTPGYQKNVVPLVGEGKVVPLMSFGITDANGAVQRDPVVPNLPTVGEVYKELNGKEPTGENWDAYLKMMQTAFGYQKNLWAAENTPPEALSALYAAAEKTVADPDFIAKGGDILGGYPSAVGNKVETTMRESFKMSDATRNYVQNLLGTKYKVS